MGRSRLFAAKMPRWLNIQCCSFCTYVGSPNCYVCLVYELQGSSCWAHLVLHRLQCWPTDRCAHNGGQFRVHTAHCAPTIQLAFANNLKLLCWRPSYTLEVAVVKTGGHTSRRSLPVTKPNIMSCSSFSSIAIHCCILTLVGQHQIVFLLMFFIITIVTHGAIFMMSAGTKLTFMVIDIASIREVI